MKKTIITIIIIAVAAVLGWFGFQQFSGPRAEQQTISREVMRVVTNFWPGQYWIEIAHKKGWFEEEGLKVELIDSDGNYFQSLQDMADGKIDTNLFVLFDLIEFNLNEAGFVAVINSDISSGADGMAVGEGIEFVSDLKGKTVGLQKATFTEYMLEVLLARNGLSSQDVVLIEVESDTPEPLASNAVDALVTWEPYLSEAAEQASGRVLFDSSEIPGLIPDILVFHEEFIQNRPEDVQAYVNVWHKTTEFMKENPDEAFGIIAGIYGRPVEDVETLAQGVKILDSRDNQTAFSYAAGFESLHGTARRINDFMIEQGLADKRLDSTEFLDSRFIRNLE
jgi:NitT/TauT family transport system substrate-binding protein